MRKNSRSDQGFMLDEEFNKKMNIANVLVKNMENKSDADRAKKWLIRVGNLKSSDLQVKKKRNAFLTCLIDVLEDGVLPVCADSCSGTVSHPHKILQLLQELDDTPDILNERIDRIHEAPEKKEIKFHSKWSKDKKTYVAVKPLPGKGALVFMAVSKRPGLQNWDLPSSKKNNQKK